jgi:hypothetical protein
LGLTFFTLPNDYSVQLHTQIWELVNYGNGFSWNDVYFMPSQWRKFYFNKLIELKKKEAEEHKKAQQQSKVRIKR